MRFLSTLVASTLGALLALGIVFFASLFFLFALVSAADQKPRVKAGSVLVLDLGGDIPEVSIDDPVARAFGEAAGYDLRSLTLALEKAAADERIEAVWMRLRGVGAPWATLQEVRRAVLAFREQGKPVYASAEDYAMDEADYFLASAADSVFASEQSLFELNGFFIAVEFYKNLLDKLDVAPQIVRAGRFKSAVEPFLRDDLSPENEEQLTALLQDQNTVFLSAVSESRGIPVDSLRRLIEGRSIFTTTAALEAGLLDGLLYEDQVAGLLRQRLGYDEDDDLPEIDVATYAKVPASDAGLKVSNDGEIAIVYATGTITSGNSNRMPLGGSATVGAETFNEAMRHARESDDVKAVVLRIDSPGGSASASDAMWREIRLTADEKPVVVSMGGLAASGGYWIATAADLIVAEPLTLTGSIGVYYTLFDVSGLFENKLGVTFDVIRTSPYADLLSGLRPLTEPERALLQRSADETYQTFLQKVAKSRGLDVARVDSIGQGRVWSGLQAQQLGLVDELGGLDRAIEIAAERAGLGEGPYRTRILPHPKSFVEQLTDAMSARVADAWLSFRTTAAERALLDQARTLHHLLSDHGTVQARLPFTVRVQ